MNTSQKIDKLLASLHTIAAAPDAADATQFQGAIRQALADTPEPSRPSGKYVDGAGGRPAGFRDTATASSETTGIRSTNWHFDTLSDRPDNSDANATCGSPAGGDREALDTPQFADLIHGDPQICLALSRCARDAGEFVHDPCEVNLSWASGIALLDGHLVGCVQYFQMSGFWAYSFGGSYCWV